MRSMKIKNEVATKKRLKKQLSSNYDADRVAHLISENYAKEDVLKRQKKELRLWRVADATQEINNC